jgi:hypothetical protein
VTENAVADRNLPGIPGVEINAGDHICALYTRRRERDDVLMPFLREGLGLGHKCLVGLYEQDTRPILDAIGTDVDVGQAVTTGQLEVLGAADLIFQPDEFSIDNMIRFWEDVVSAAVQTGPFPFARLTAECTWWEKQLPGFDALAHYESALNKFAARHPLGFLCMYDMSEIDGGVVFDLLRTHPRVLLCGLLIENPYYEPIA